jgi:prepilin peptidase CpaA
MIAAIPLLLLFATLCAAALQDIVQLRISNVFPGLVLLLYFANGMITGHWHWQQSLVLFAIFFSVGLLLFRFNFFGGGDVKLLCALALWCSFSSVGGLLLSIVFFGGLAAVLFIIARRMLPAALVKRLGWPGLVPLGPIPYGMAIAAGTIFCFTPIIYVKIFL